MSSASPEARTGVTVNSSVSMMSTMVYVPEPMVRESPA